MTGCGRLGQSRVYDFRSNGWQCSATPCSAAAPERKRPTTWPVFIRTHLALLAGTDFFTAEVPTLRGLVTYYVLFFIHLESRWVDIAGITIHPGELWIKQIARNVTMEGGGVLRDCRYLLHDRDTKYTQSFRTIIASGRVEPLALPARSPNLNAYAEALGVLANAQADYRRTSPARPVGRAMKGWDNSQCGSIPRSNRSEPRINIWPYGLRPSALAR
jgi:hypothetical protein